MATDYGRMINLLQQLNTNVVLLKRLLEDIRREGLRVRTQESHQP